ncbi:MAG: hypothetical protein ACOCU4_09895 [Alkalispirochaeta sp.]
MAKARLDSDYSGRAVPEVEDLVDDRENMSPEEYVDMFVILEDGTKAAYFGDVCYPLDAEERIDFEHPISLR